MARRKRPSRTNSLLDWVRPTDSDGRLKGAVFSTYGLDLDQPNFFEHDFLPTLLGLGGVRDRGMVAPVTLERRLAEVDCTLICDAHALSQGARPSLRIDVVPISQQTHHAKIQLIHRQRLVRVIISSANLTHTGFRHQRETAIVLDFRKGGELPVSVLKQLADSWMSVLGPCATESLIRTLRNAVAAAEEWENGRTDLPLPEIRVVFGGGDLPLWQQLVNAWPAGEPVRLWQVCSPFWPASESNHTPFDAIADGLKERAVAFDDSRIELICMGDCVGERARPLFPFELLKGLRQRDFPITQGRIFPARLDALVDEVPDGRSEGHRILHAKWIRIQGPETALALVGSANFTNSGMGLARKSNIEAGVLFKGSIKSFLGKDWLPPIAHAGAADWNRCGEFNLVAPAQTAEEPFLWPVHIQSVVLEIHWKDGETPAGTLRFILNKDHFVTTQIFDNGQEGTSENSPLISLETLQDLTQTVFEVSLDPLIVRRLLWGRVVGVRWGTAANWIAYPININHLSKSQMPSVLGARPDENQLLSYFQGRISEDDLIAALEAEVLSKGNPEGQQTTKASLPGIELQSYLVRAFVEGTFGIEDVLRTSQFSPRAFEMALLGDFSPRALAESVLSAFRSGRRSPTATAFQLCELLRIVDKLVIDEQSEDLEKLSEITTRARESLLRIISDAAKSRSLAEVLANRQFAEFVRASLSGELARQVIATATESISVESVTEGAMLHDLKA